ncbi:MAG TPA: hypothetical protein VMH33_09435 [Solirubrobacterales bacterium]|nr:hypothetical protein [Solirubrobacterales bacterium]
MSNGDPARRREIEESTAARLAEIVAVAERAARQVIDEAEAEARARLASAEGEADRIIGERLAALTAMTAEIDTQAAALRTQAEELQRTLARAKAELAGGRDADPVARPAAEAAERRPSSPALTVVGEASPQPATAEHSPVPDPGAINAAAGARLLATQMAVSGSSRAEIEQRLHDGFELADTDAILDAILGPER